MATTNSSQSGFKPKRLFKVTEELNVVTDKIVAFLEENGYEDDFTGTNVTDRITSEEAYLALKEEFASDAESAARPAELRAEQDEAGGPDRDEVATIGDEASSNEIDEPSREPEIPAGSNDESEEASNEVDVEEVLENMSDFDVRLSRFKIELYDSSDVPDPDVPDSEDIRNLMKEEGYREAISGEELETSITDAKAGFFLLREYCSDEQALDIITELYKRPAGLSYKAELPFSGEESETEDETSSDTPEEPNVRAGEGVLRSDRYELRGISAVDKVDLSSQKRRKRKRKNKEPRPEEYEKSPVGGSEAKAPAEETSEASAGGSDTENDSSSNTPEPEEMSKNMSESSEEPQEADVPRELESGGSNGEAQPPAQITNSQKLARQVATHTMNAQAEAMKRATKALQSATDGNSRSYDYVKDVEGRVTDVNDPLSEESKEDKGFDKLCIFAKKKEKETGLRYPEKLLRRVWTRCRSAKSQLIVLAGPPGSGKTSLVRLLAEFFNRESSKSDEFYHLQPVSPSWFGPESLLGSTSAIDGRFHDTPFLRFIIRANKHYKSTKGKSRWFFACLDEFNLAHPEQYLADILSKMEEPVDSEERNINVYKRQVNGKTDSLTVRLTPNLKLFATVNTDVSTKALSPKVLDRCFFLRLTPEYSDLKKVAEKHRDEHEVSSFHEVLFEEESFDTDEGGEAIENRHGQH